MSVVGLPAGLDFFDIEEVRVTIRRENGEPYDEYTCSPRAGLRMPQEVGEYRYDLIAILKDGGEVALGSEAHRIIVSPALRYEGRVKLRAEIGEGWIEADLLDRQHEVEVEPHLGPGYPGRTRTATDELLELIGSTFEHDAGGLLKRRLRISIEELPD